MLTKSFQNFNKISSKKGSSTLFNFNSSNEKPTFQRFQHLLYNKPAKVENNQKSFQTVFMLGAKIFNKHSH